MKAKLENIDGVDYLTFTPEGKQIHTTLPVITQGSREKNNAWTWNGDLEKPTLRPSIKTRYTNDDGNEEIFHCWLTDGVCQCLSDCTDGNSGKYIPLINVHQ